MKSIIKRLIVSMMALAMVLARYSGIINEG